VQWLSIGLGYYTGHPGQITEATTEVAKNTASRFAVATGVHVDGYRFAAEYFTAKNYKAGSGDGNSSYTIGGTGVAGTGASTDGKFSEVGIYSQIVF